MTEKPTENSQSAESTNRTRGQTTFRFWLWVWAGTTVAGGVWGAGFGCTAGLKNGPLYDPFSGTLFGFFGGIVGAGSLGTAVVAITAILTRLKWLSRFEVVMGGVAGGLTGFAATLPFALSPPPGFTSAMLFLPVWIGGIGSTVAAFVYSSRIESHHFPLEGSKRPWQLSLRDLVAIIAVLAAIFATLAFVATSARMGDQSPAPHKHQSR